MVSVGNRLGRRTGLKPKRAWLGIVVVAAVLSACTGATSGGSSTPSSTIAPATEGGSPTVPVEPGWLAVDTRFHPRIFFTEGSLTFLKVFDASGTLIRTIQAKDQSPRFRLQLEPGTYDLRTYRRPCDGSCSALDPPVDVCEFSAEMGPDGSSRLMIVRSVGLHGECNVSDKGDVIDFALDTPVADFPSLRQALIQAGHEAQMKPGDRWLSRWFLTRDRAMRVGGDSVHVFEYARAREQRQIEISSDGTGISSRGGPMVIVEWSPPHYYRSGRLLVLYFGQDPILLETLNLLLGPSSSGR